MTKGKYAQAGVDFDLEHGVVGIFRQLFEKTRPNAADLEDIGISFPTSEEDFSGGFTLNANYVTDRFRRFKFLQSTDGPGTKPIVHAIYNGEDPVKLSSTAHDSIAMAVNDLVCCGARPLTLLEYHAWHTPDLEIAAQMAVGNLRAANMSRAVITGGENASLSSMITGPIPKKAYDMCHMATGYLDDPDIIDKPLGPGRVKPGDWVIGLSSSGIHCNGITLPWTAAIDYKNRGFEYSFLLNKKDSQLGESLAEAILTPTIIYVRPVLELINDFEQHIHAIANITGEGVHNMHRVIPAGTGLQLNYDADGVQKQHPIFGWVQKHAEVSEKEMYEVYNMGTGMVLIVNPATAKDIIRSAHELGQASEQPFSAYKLGEVNNEAGVIRVDSHEHNVHIYGGE
ncbi:MAG: hypothetical protein KKG59_00410 [Nanoarchaeota archaeon]|nr:hypothetical protein [Nanoarchaeota archaeon]